MTQTIAILLDAYRELNSRKLFWIAMVLSGLVVAAFALVGINEQGLRLLAWDVPFPVNTSIMSEETFYKTLFVGLGIKFWLAWLSTILALVSTAGIFPDLVSGGSIDLVLSKPISRARLFFTRYAGGLLFTALQVGVFSAASFFVLGLAGGAWEPGVFLAIPVMVLFYSYLFAVCVLLGLLTRSTVAALLLTLLVWFVVFALHSAESVFLMTRVNAEQEVEALERHIASSEKGLAALEQPAQPAPAPEAGQEPEPDREAEARTAARAEAMRTRLAERRVELEAARKKLDRLALMHRVSLGVKTALPKTSETIGLLERWLISLAELPEPPDEGQPGGVISDSGRFLPDAKRSQQRMIEEIRDRPVWWIVGTSLAFEAIVLGIAALIFQRRDF